MMPRGPITKYEIESHLYKLKDELNERNITWRIQVSC